MFASSVYLVVMTIFFFATGYSPNFNFLTLFLIFFVGFDLLGQLGKILKELQGLRSEISSLRPPVSSEESRKKLIPPKKERFPLPDCECD
jgi:hypothetical protein